MALPLPSVVSNVGPGGPFMDAQNAFYQNSINRANSQYAQPDLAAELQRQQLANQASQATVKYAGPQANALLQSQLLANKKSTNELPWAGPMAAAKTASAAAYANIVGYQNIQKLLSDPVAVRTLRSTAQGEQKYQHMVLAQASMSANPAGAFFNSLGGPSNPFANQGSSQGNGVPNNKPGDQLLNMSVNKMNQPINPLQNIGQGTVLAPTSQNSLSNSNQPNIQNSPVPAQPENTPAPDQGLSGFEPNVATEGKESESAAKTLGERYGTDTGNYLTKLNNEAEKAPSQIRNLLAFDKLFNELNPAEYGTIKPTNAPLSSAAKSVDQLAATIGSDMIPTLSNGHGATQGQLSLIRQLKVGRHLDLESERRSINQLLAPHFANQDIANIAQSLAEKNYNPYQMQQVVNRYLDERPMYNPETGDLIYKNKGSYQDYLKPEVLKAIQNNQETPLPDVMERNKQQRMMLEGRSGPEGASKSTKIGGNLYYTLPDGTAVKKKVS